MQHSTTLKRLLLLVAAWVVGLVSADAAVYYVATTGSASVNATQAQNPATPARTITQAIGFAADGDAIIIGPGNFGGFTSTKRLTISGAGKGVTVCTTTVTLRAPGGSAANRTVLSNLSCSRTTGPSNSLLVQQSFVTLNEIYVSGSNRGVYLSFPTADFPVGSYEMQDIMVWDSEIEQNTGQGFNFNSGGSDREADFHNIRIYNTSFSNNSALASTPTGGSGLLWTKQNTATNKGGVWDVIVKGCTFSGNLSKGIYAEQLRDAHFENITIEGSGFDGSGHAAGIDFNFLGNDYANAANGGNDAFVNGNITFLNCRISGCGWGDNNGAAVIIKARNDNAVRWVDPARVENILFKGCAITNNRGGIRFGESNNLLFPGTGIVNTISGTVKIEYCDFTGNATGDPAIIAHPWSNYGAVTNPQGNKFGIRNFTTANINAQNNFFGGIAPTVYEQKIPTFTGQQTSGSNQITNVNVDFTAAGAPNLVGKYIYGSFRQIDGNGGPNGGNGVIAGDASSGIATPSYDQFAAAGTNFAGGITVASVVNATTIQLSGNATATRQSTFFIYSPQDVIANQGTDISNISTTGSIDANNFLTAPIVRVNGAFEGSFSTLADALATASAGDTILNVPAGNLSGVSLASNVTIMSPGARLEGNSGTSLSNATVSGKAKISGHMAFTGNLTLNNDLDISGAFVRIDGTVSGSGKLKGDANTTLIITGAGDLGTLNFVPGGDVLGTLRVKREGTVKFGQPLSVDFLRLDTGIIVNGDNTLMVNNSFVQGTNTGANAHVNGRLALNPGMGGVFSLKYPLGNATSFGVVPGDQVVRSENVTYTVSAEGPNYYALGVTYKGANSLGRAFTGGINRVSFDRYYTVERSGSSNVTNAALSVGVTSNDFVSDVNNLTFARTGFSGGNWEPVNTDAFGSPTVTSVDGDALNPGVYALANIAPGTNLTNASLVVSNTPSLFCRDSVNQAVNFSLGYSSNGSFLPGATIAAFITDGVNPVLIGTTGQNPPADGIINAQLPAGLASGSNYRIYLAEPLASVLSPDNGSNITVTVTPAPAEISADGPLVFCQGGDVELTANGNFATYLWNTGATTQSIVATTGGKYWVIGTSAAGCVADTSAFTTVVVNPNPTRPVITTVSGDNSLCSGDSVIIAGPEGFALYSWSNGASTREITVDEAGAYTLTVADDNGCISPASLAYNVVVNPIPSAPQITSEDNFEVCFGDSVQLSGPAGFASYIWTLGADQVTGKDVYAKVSGTVTLQVISDSGCISPAASQPVVVRSQLDVPAISIASGTATFCDGDSVVLKGPAGFASYIWSDGNEEVVSDSVRVKGTASVTLRVKDAFGCVSPVSLPFQTTEVEIPSAPAKPGTDDVFCEGNAVTLRAPAGFAQYLWSNGSTADTLVVATTGSYSVRVSNGNDCFGPASEAVEIFVNALPDAPTITYVGNQSFCIGDSVKAVLSTNLAGDFAFIWDGVEHGDSSEAVFYTTTSVNVQVKNLITGCISRASTIEVEDNAIPAAPVFAIAPSTGDTTVCAGETVTLKAADGATSYFWSNGETTQEITVSSTDTVWFFAANGGCITPNSDTIVVNVRESFAGPVVTFSGATLTGDNGVFAACAPNFVTIRANASAFVGGTIFIVNTFGTPRVIAADSIVIDSSDVIGVIGINEFGCASTATLGALNVIKLPDTPSILGITSPDTAICFGTSITLSAPAGFAQYLWSNGDTTETTTISSDQSVSVRVSNGNGCFSTASDVLNVTVRPEPAAPVITLADGSLNFCDGDTITLTGPADAVLYAWTVNGLPLIGANNTELKVFASAKVTLRVTNANGCLSAESDTTTAVLFPIPGKPAINVISTNGTNVCGGDTVKIEGPAGFSEYIWSNGASGQVVFVTESTQVSLRVANEAGCVSAFSDTIDVIVRPTPTTPTFSFVGSPAFCDGDSVLVIVNTTGGTGDFEYIWNGVSAGTQDTLWVKDDITLDVQINDLTSGCSSGVASVRITSDPKPAKPTFAVKPLLSDTTVCDGSPVVLSAPEGFNYRWSNGASTRTINATEAGTYFFQVANGGCFSDNSDSVVIRINPLPATPVITASADSICPGGSVTISAPTGFASYLWITGATTESITAYADTAYTVIVTDANGCISAPATPFALRVLPTPVKPSIIDTVGSVIFCAGDSVVVTAEAGFASYLWSNGETTQTATFKSSGRYAVVVTNLSGCSSVSSDSVEVTAVPLPAVPVVNNTRPLTFCAGDSTVLEGPAGFAAYTWSNGAATQSITVKTTENLTLTVTNAAGCVSPAATVNVVSNPVPAAVSIVQRRGGTTLCFGDSVILGVNNYVPGVTYLWSSGANTLVADSIAFRGIAVGSANVTVTPIIGTCSGPVSAAFGLTVKANPNAGVNIFTNGARAQNIAAGLTYQWRTFPAGTVVSNTDSLEAINGGQFTLTVTDPTGGVNCVTTSAPITITGLTELADAGVRMFPNPASQSVNVELNGVTNAETVALTFINSIGVTVKSEVVHLNNGQASINLNLDGVAKGVYLVQFNAAGKRVTRRLTVN